MGCGASTQAAPDVSGKKYEATPDAKPAGKSSAPTKTDGPPAPLSKSASSLVLPKPEVTKDALHWSRARLIARLGALGSYGQTADAQIGGRVLVLYASDTEDKADFAAACKDFKAEYDFETATAESLMSQLDDLVAQAGGKFTAIALACHGPSSEEAFELKVSNAVSASGAAELAADESHPVMLVMKALANACEPHGRVDLLACSLLRHPDGLAAFQHIEKETTTHFAVRTALAKLLPPSPSFSHLLPP